MREPNLRSKVHLMFVNPCTVCLLTAVCTINVVYGSPASEKEDTRKQYLFLLQGFKHERERLRSAIVHVDFQIGPRPLSDKPERKASEQVLCALDYDRDKVRFDRTRGDRIGKYIRTALYGLVADMKDNVVESGVVGKLRPDESPGNLVQFFDLRCIGLLNMDELQREKPQHPFSAVMDAFQSEQFADTTELVYEENGIVSVTQKWTDVESIKWFDTQRGYAPVKIEQRLVPQDGKEPVLLDLCNTNWEQIAGVWLPVHATDVDRDGKKQEMTLHWQSVNAAVPDTLFDLKDFNLRSNAILLDTRVKPQLIEKLISVAGPLKLTDVESTSKKWLIAINIGVICLIVLLLVLRQQHKRRMGL